jgi:hypothetical protein
VRPSGGPGRRCAERRDDERIWAGDSETTSAASWVPGGRSGRGEMSEHPGGMEQPQGERLRSATGTLPPSAAPAVFVASHSRWDVTADVVDVGAHGVQPQSARGDLSSPCDKFTRVFEGRATTSRAGR